MDLTGMADVVPQFHSYLTWVLKVSFPRTPVLPLRSHYPPQGCNARLFERQIEGPSHLVKPSVKLFVLVKLVNAHPHHYAFAGRRQSIRLTRPLPLIICSTCTARLARRHSYRWRII